MPLHFIHTATFQGGEGVWEHLSSSLGQKGWWKGISQFFIHF